ncbi:MAG: SDR family oxidoreductase [Armatimonadetes bacterium]|nr:SDR family oxidoreductase [Armatimonadota bacterium]
MKKLFITGGSGMLGSYAAVQAAEKGWDVTASYRRNAIELPGCRTVQLELSDAERVLEVIASASPNAIIHTAAQAKPDFCEQNKLTAFESNVIGTFNIVRAAEKIGAHLVHISTDTVFNGEKNPYKENDTLSPPNYYGLTKAAAEAAVATSNAGWAIVRTSIIFGPRKFPFQESFSDKIIDALKAGNRIKAYADQYRCPIPAWNLADACLEIVERRLTGIFHVECPNVVSRLEWALKIAEVFNLPKSLIEPMYMDSSPGIANRSKILVLDVSNTVKQLRTPLLGFEESINELKRRMTND